MTFKPFIGLLLLLGFSYCTRFKTNSVNEPYLGLNITNDPIRGSNYADTTTLYAYRYVKATITNDTVVPVHLKITFQEDLHYLAGCKDWQFKAFLLPDTMTNEKQYDFAKNTHFVSTNLEKFLDTELKNHIVLSKTIKPKESCTINIGLLIGPEYTQPQVLLFSKGQRFSFYSIPDDTLKKNISTEDRRTLFLGVNFGLCYKMIPCGQVSYD